MLELWQDGVRAVHVQAKQVLDPVMGVRTAARRGTYLRDPWPDRRRRRADLDCPGRDTIGPSSTSSPGAPRETTNRRNVIATDLPGALVGSHPKSSAPWRGKPRTRRGHGPSRDGCAYVSRGA